jgi:hypothetical protein
VDGKLDYTDDTGGSCVNWFVGVACDYIETTRALRADTNLCKDTPISIVPTKKYFKLVHEVLNDSLSYDLIDRYVLETAPEPSPIRFRAKRCLRKNRQQELKEEVIRADDDSSSTVDVHMQKHTEREAEGMISKSEKKGLFDSVLWIVGSHNTTTSSGE